MKRLAKYTMTWAYFDVMVLGVCLYRTVLAWASVILLHFYRASLIRFFHILPNIIIRLYMHDIQVLLLHVPLLAT